MKKIFLLLITALYSPAFAQLNPIASTYFLNPYGANPSLAGIQNGINLIAAIKAQWQAIPGGPSMQHVSGSIGLPEGRVGIGLNLNNEKAGVIKRISIKGSYAYHLPLDWDGTFLDLGLSAGITSEVLDMNQVLAVPDESINNFNRRKPYMDGDFGASYRSEHLTIQTALFNLKRLFNNSQNQERVVDRSLFRASFSYKIFFPESANGIEPMFTFRGVEGYQNLWDSGVNLVVENQKLIANGMYHSTGSLTFGVGTVYQSKLTILAQYTSNTAKLKTYANGEFEIALKYFIKTQKPN